MHAVLMLIVLLLVCAVSSSTAEGRARAQLAIKPIEGPLWIVNGVLIGGFILAAIL